ncbi:DinB family protein [Mucilaginibacter ginkgonis]|uniref:DinB family protein n=1 Tax=Mucilaginibacter ginkgonis TaxID=2682091 RepID=A0A6I4HZD0_9SPHI|nr:DinB family protein [Mucilaginibacter ginkgonis]QQL49339.1 DinB family protein [Mucilaginibacter ginkgonis]
MNKLAKEFKAVSLDLKQTIHNFDDEQFNKVPGIGGWTAGQAAEHIHKSMRGLPLLLMRNTVPSTREPEQHVKTLRDMFLDFEAKYEAAPALQPSTDHHDKDDLEQKIVSILDKLAEIAATEDLTQLCTGFEFPTIGQLTRSEMLNFTSAHTQRHIHQMKKIKEVL